MEQKRNDVRICLQVKPRRVERTGRETQHGRLRVSLLGGRKRRRPLIDPRSLQIGRTSLGKSLLDAIEGL